MAEAEGSVLEAAVGWEVGGGYVDAVEVLSPFEGYLVKNLADSTVALNIPPTEFTPGAVEQPSRPSDLGNPGTGAFKSGQRLRLQSTRAISWASDRTRLLSGSVRSLGAADVPRQVDLPLLPPPDRGTSIPRSTPRTFAVRMKH